MPSASNAQGKALRISDAEGCLVEMRRDAASSFDYKKQKTLGWFLTLKQPCLESGVGTTVHFKSRNHLEIYGSRSTKPNRTYVESCRMRTIN